MNNSDVYRQAYNKGHEILPDFIYDNIFDQDSAELNDIGHGKLVQHLHPMLSLPTFFLNVDGITADNLKIAGVNTNNELALSFKLDGVPCSCIYEHNAWKRAVSRGKRYAGFIVSNAFLSILPKPKLVIDANTVIDFRGEFVISKSDFIELNALLPENLRYANSRSMVSGQINSANPDTVILNKMHWFAHGIYINDKPLNHLAELSKWFEPADICPNINIEPNSNKIFAEISRMYNLAMDFEYPCDGIVIQHKCTTDNDGKCNLDRVAIKQSDEAKFSAETTVKSIEWRLANNGAYFPRLHFEPVLINGSQVTHAAAYCWDYLQKLGLSIGASVVVTMRGGVIPYVSKVLHIGNGDYAFPKDAIMPETGDIQLWSSSSNDAICRLRFIRGMQMLSIDDCGIELFSDMYEAGYKTLFDIAIHVRNNAFIDTMLAKGILPNTPATLNKCKNIIDRFTTFNYVFLIMALREPGIGFKSANAIGQMLSGYHLVDARELQKQAIVAFLNKTELLDMIRQYSNPVALEHADLSIELANTKQSSNKLKVCMSKKPSNGMTKSDFAKQYLANYDITDNIKEANLLICPVGEQSNKINYAKANNIEIRDYEYFIK